VASITRGSPVLANSVLVQRVWRVRLSIQAEGGRASGRAPPHRLICPHRGAMVELDSHHPLNFKDVSNPSLDISSTLMSFTTGSRCLIVEVAHLAVTE